MNAVTQGTDSNRHVNTPNQRYNQMAENPRQHYGRSKRGEPRAKQRKSQESQREIQTEAQWTAKTIIRRAKASGTDQKIREEVSRAEACRKEIQASSFARKSFPRQRL